MILKYLIADIYVCNKVSSIIIKDCLHLQLFVYNSFIHIWWLLVYQNPDTKQKHQQEKTTRHHNYIGTLWVQQLYPSSLGRICKLKIVTNIFQTWLRNSLYQHLITIQQTASIFTSNLSRYRSVIKVNKKSTYYRVFNSKMLKWKGNMQIDFLGKECLHWHS